MPARDGERSNDRAFVPDKTGQQAGEEYRNPVPEGLEYEDTARLRVKYMKLILD